MVVAVAVTTEETGIAVTIQAVKTVTVTMTVTACRTGYGQKTLVVVKLLIFRMKHLAVRKMVFPARHPYRLHSEDKLHCVHVCAPY